MKKVTLLFAFVAFLSYVGISQSLTWQFANYEVVNAGTQLQFDVEVMASTATTYHRDLQVYFDYNTAGFGADWVAGSHVTVTPLSLMDNFYSVVNTVDNTGSKIAIITEADNEMTQIGNAGGFNLMPGAFTGLFQVKMDITDNTATAGISFDEALMNGGQYYQSTSAIEPVKYADPCTYANNLLINKLSTVYGNITYANGASTPLSDITVKLMNGVVEVGSGISLTSGDYYISSIDDGSYTLENTTTKTWGGLSMNDVLMTRQKAAGVGSFTTLQELAMDVSNEGQVLMNDVLMLRQRMGTVISSWPAPDYVFETQSVTVVSGVGAKSYQGLCSGDPDGSFTPPLSK